MNTPIIQTLLPLLSFHGQSQAKTFLEGGESIGGTCQDEVIEFLARQDVGWNSLSTAEQDQLTDAYLSGFKGFVKGES